MSAAEQEYDVCAAQGCHGVPVAVWEVQVAIGAPPDTFVAVTDLPVCAGHWGHLTRESSLSGRAWVRPVNS